MASGTRNSIPTHLESYTLSECCTEVNEVSPATSETILVAQKMTTMDDMQTELVIGSLFIQCKLSFHLCC